MLEKTLNDLKYVRLIIFLALLVGVASSANLAKTASLADSGVKAGFRNTE